jgi:hypothetical protein
MTAEEIKDALMKKYPVCAGGITYKCVTAVIYREQDGKITVSGELLDRCGHSVTVVPLKNIEKKGD